jgi:lipopolysaccharide/colanic/teichoic acid biosynthesis glycosyltransferase
MMAPQSRLSTAFFGEEVSLRKSRRLTAMELTAPITTQPTARPYSESWRQRAERCIPKSWISTKRATDIALALIGLTLTAPIISLAMILIVICSPGSPIFAQERVGVFGRRFTMYKLRTMKRGAHAQQDALRNVNEATGPVFKMKSDPRVFPLGRMLRKLSIDEVPNLVNVLLGQMSIVGPRPPLPSEVENYNDFALRRLRVKPGITCVWQISGRSNVDFNEWMRLDHAYIDNWSPLYDLKIILSTIPAVLFSKGAY